jgi:hypothetical protein
MGIPAFTTHCTYKKKVGALKLTSEGWGVRAKVYCPLLCEPDKDSQAAGEREV